jgi:carbon-monoxide dehydrogenase medium subunit
VIPTAFDYERAVSIDDAVAKLSAANGNAKLIAGGHTLVPLMKLRLSEPQILIDIGVKHIDMMLRPEKLWRIIHGGQA